MNWAWGLAAAIAIVDAVWMPLAGLRVEPGALVKSLAAGVGLLILLYVYTYRRPNAVLAALLESAAFLVLFTHALAISSYLATALGRPLYDSAFDGFDKALGFDFINHLAYVGAHPALALVLEATYATSMLQVGAVVLLLAFTQQIDRLRAFIVLFAATVTVTIIVAAILPTIGTYAFYDVPDALLPPFRDPRTGWDQVGHVLALRDGTMRTIPLHDLKGLVSFPSFHTSLAMIIVWAMLRTRYATAGFLALNLPLILATPTNGSHYLCDILGGAIIAFAAIGVISGYERRSAVSPLALPMWEIRSPEP